MDKKKLKKNLGLKSKRKVDKRPSKKKLDSKKKKRNSNSKRFSCLSPASIATIAESIGILALSDDIKNSLAEDVTYKVREIVQNCYTAVRNNKRLKILTSDVNRFVELLNAPPVFGHTVGHNLEYAYNQDADVYFINDVEVDIVKMAKAKTEFIKPNDECLKGKWYLQDPTPMEKIEFPPVSNPPPNNAGSKDQKPTTSSSSASTTPVPTTSTESSSTAKTEPSVSQPRPYRPDDQPHAIVSKPPPHFINYYLQVARVVIGGSEIHLKVAVADLRANPNIGPLTPYFLNLVALTVNKLQRHYRLTDALLRTIEAIVHNPHVDPSSHFAVNRAVNALLVIAIEPKVATRCDDLLLRMRAAFLLQKVVLRWNIELKQQIDIVRRLLQLLLDGNISLKSHFGAIFTLIALGEKALNPYFWPIIERYSLLLEDKERKNFKVDAQHARGAVLTGAAKMYRQNLKQLTHEDMRRMRLVDEKLYEYFGEAIIPQRRQLFIKKVQKRKRVKKVTKKTRKRSLRRTSLVFKDRGCRVKRYNTLVTNPHLLRVPCNLNIPNNQPQNNSTPKVKYTTEDVFSFPEPAEPTKEILFNFVGSNQVSCEFIRLSKLSATQIYYCEMSRSAQLWSHQNIYKNTRTIKYCSPLHKKSNAGNLFMLL